MQDEFFSNEWCWTCLGVQRRREAVAGRRRTDDPEVDQDAQNARNAQEDAQGAQITRRRHLVGKNSHSFSRTNYWFIWNEIWEISKRYTIILKVTWKRW